MAIQIFRLKIVLWVLLCISPQFALADGGLYQLHDDGQIWAYDGSSQCPDDVNAYCPGWSLIDRNPATEFVAASGAGLFQLADSSPKCNSAA
jgi:hypothetical protein